MEIESCTALFARRANAPIHTWTRVSGPMSSVVATLIDLGYAHHMNRASGHHRLEIVGNLRAVRSLVCWKRCARVHHMEGAKASEHMDASGREHGVDICDFHQQLTWLSRKELHDQAGIMKAAAGGSLWPAARLNV